MNPPVTQNYPQSAHNEHHVTRLSLNFEWNFIEICIWRPSSVPFRWLFGAVSRTEPMPTFRQIDLKWHHGGETSIDIRRLAYASELSSVVIRRQNTQNTDLRSENPVTRYLNAFLRTSMGCISSRNIHTSIGIHFGHDAMDPICVIRVPVNVHAECVWAILRNLYKSKQYRKYVAYE